MITNFKNAFNLVKAKCEAIIDNKNAYEMENDENCIYLRDEYNEISGKIINIGKNRITLIPTSVVGYYPELEIARFYYIPK